MNLQIRTEHPDDFPLIKNIIRSAFKGMANSDHTEQYLVERLRHSEAYIPELSLVAVVDQTLVGHIFLTKLEIINGHDVYDSLALAPVSVLPEYQGKGIGGGLILEAHNIAINLSYSSVILIGHKEYYPRFGYQQARQFGIELPFDVPYENCFAIELVDQGLKGKAGMVRYPPAFYG